MKASWKQCLSVMLTSLCPDPESSLGTYLVCIGQYLLDLWIFINKSKKKMIISIIKNGTMCPVNLFIKCNLKYIALLIKYSCQKVEPESNHRFRTSIQYTGNEERDKLKCSLMEPNR